MAPLSIVAPRIPPLRLSRYLLEGFTIALLSWAVAAVELWKDLQKQSECVLRRVKKQFKYLMSVHSYATRRIDLPVPIKDQHAQHAQCHLASVKLALICDGLRHPVISRGEYGPIIFLSTPP